MTCILYHTFLLGMNVDLGVFLCVFAVLDCAWCSHIFHVCSALNFGMAPTGKLQAILQTAGMCPR